MDDAILPECYVDTNLIETLVPPKRRGFQHGYNHQKGCGTVAKKMIENFGDSFALGIIDKDRKDIDYLAEFDIVIQRGNLLLHKHRTKHHYIIQISPAIERFILNNAAVAGITLPQYGLPSDFERLKKVAKTKNSKDDPTFKALFKAIDSIGTPEFATLAAWVGYLKATTYHVDLGVIKAL